MKTTRHGWVPVALAVMLAAGSRATAQEEGDLRPEIAQLVQSVSERLEAVADQLGLTADQRSKMREVHATYAEKYKSLKDARRELLRSELAGLNPNLTPEQREKVKGFAEDRIEARTTAAADRGWPRFAAMRDTVAERIQGAGASLGLTDEQRKKVREAHAQFAEKHRADRAQRRQLVEDEFKALAAILTPEQRQKARDAIEQRVVRAAIVSSVAERLDATSDAMGLNTDQRQKILAAHRPYAEKYRSLREERRQLLHDELQAISAVLSPDQREKVKDFCEDRIVVVEFAVEGRDRAEALKNLRETVAERLETVADQLGLTADQRAKIWEIHATFAGKFEDQRAERRALRQQELGTLNSILTPEQRQKTKDYVEDRLETSRGS
jgi:Spy/CpxP family protein refolding chaperone